MPVFSPDLVEEMQRLPGGSHSFLRQVCGDQGLDLRQGLESELGRLDPAVRGPLADGLRSLDNRRFFQAFAELSVLSSLRSTGWTTLGTSDRVLCMARPDGSPCNVLVTSFLHPGRLELDARPLVRLRQALSRVHARLRFAVFVRRALPADFDPAPVRQAVEIWLREVEGGRWDSRFAAFEDDQVALEFGLVGDQGAPVRARDGQDPVLMTLGPFLAARTIGSVERRVVESLDAYRMGEQGDLPVVSAMVSDRPWTLSPGYLREFLYGKPSWVTSGADGWEAALSQEPEPCLFKDSLYGSLAGCLVLARSDTQPLALVGKACSNPFSMAPLRRGEQPFALLSEVRREGQLPVLRWSGDKAHVQRLGA
jgi:hypothetical protein